MSKVICEICGTSYPETADSCPICGYSRDLGAAFLDDDFLLEEELTETVVPKEKNGRFSNSKKKKEIFDYDEVNPEEDDLEDEDYPDDEDDDDEDEYEEEPRHNTFLVILLVVLIMVLLAVAGYIFLRYFMPNVFPRETVATTEAVLQEEETTQSYEIPCTNLVLTSGEAKITAAGYYHLLNVIVQPEDTTDELVFSSEDENIATVSEDGRITAVSEGTTNIYITCGSQQRICPVTCIFEETSGAAEETVDVQTVPAETVPEETAGGEEAPAETQVEETTPTEATEASEVTAQVTLKLKDTDIRLGVGYGHTILLDCDLKHEDIEWRIEHEYIAKVDDKGFVTALANGTTAVIAKYGDQEVQCILRCYSLW